MILKLILVLLVIFTPNLSAALSLEDNAQQISYNGTVTDENGNPLPGVTVLIKGSTLGTLTDASGKYSINNAPPNAILVFSFIGMTTQEIPSGKRTIIDIVMKEEAIGLEEVVVIGSEHKRK